MYKGGIGGNSMILCFDCTSEVKKILDDLIKSGQFRDYAEAISVAISNQAVLQERVVQDGSFIIGDDNPQINNPGPKPSSSSKPSFPRKSYKNNGKVEVPELFRLSGIEHIPTPLAPLPADKWKSDQAVPLDQWIFGQYNKLLPAKANCRALAHLLLKDPSGVPLSEATSSITEQAALLGDFLKTHDEVVGATHDDRTFIVFPSSDVYAGKTHYRYANQFIGIANKQGKISGLLIDLKLINQTDEKKPRLLLTEPGWKFAALMNPVLDSDQHIPTPRFNSQEISFLLGHIVQSVPTEFFAYRTILGAILGGADTPDEIDLSLKKINSSKKEGLTKAFLATQRSGAISRMADLDLVRRIREGVKVSYQVTSGGEAFIKRSK
jgi:hypothetical protein